LEFILYIAVSFLLNRAFTVKKLLQDARMAIFLIVVHAPTFSSHNAFGIHPAHHCQFPSELSTHIQKTSATCKGWLSLINTNVPTFSSHNVWFRSEDKPPVSYSNSVSNDKPKISHAIFTLLKQGYNSVLQTHIPPLPTLVTPSLNFWPILQICFRRDHCNQVKTEMNAVAIGNPSKW
jgi:hypothetical protein